MADPITTDHFRAMAVWRYKTGEPGDVMVNSFVARNDSSDPTGNPHVAFAAAIENFYFDMQSNGSAISTFMRLSQFEALEILTYDLGVAPPRPRTTTVIDLTGRSSATAEALPQECAVCATWLTDTPGRRGRGRTYLGGFSASALDLDTSTNRVIVAEALRNTIALAADIYLHSNNANVTPVILGIGGTKVITHGYVDDAWDTQRRRGTEPVARTLFPPVAP